MDGLPNSVDREFSETLRAYVAALRRLFADDLIGVYLHGSVACGAYRPGISDLDLTVVHASDLTVGQMLDLQEMHVEMGRQGRSDRLDVSFVPLRLVGTYGDDALPYYRDGLFSRSGGGDVNPVTWRTLRGRGIAVWGIQAVEIVPPVSDEELAEYMRRNLAFLRRRMPAYALTGTATSVFGVLSLCRVLHTLRTGEIVGKVPAARWATRNLDRRWRSLIQHAVGRYESGDLSAIDAVFRLRSLVFAAHLREEP